MNRSMTKERRKFPRFKVNFPVRWEGVLTQQTGTVSSLSESGCFVLTGGQVQQKELIRVEIDFPDLGALCFWSEVVDEAYEIGFAVRFTSASDGDMELLKASLKNLTP
jgi:hypothetical protein